MLTIAFLAGAAWMWAVNAVREQVRRHRVPALPPAWVITPRTTPHDDEGEDEC